MPQEFRVVKCFKCETYQVDIVKKSKKWICKMCGEKQSILQEFSRGISSQCRLQVQKLNHNRFLKEEENNLNLLNREENDLKIASTNSENYENPKKTITSHSTSFDYSPSLNNTKKVSKNYGDNKYLDFEYYQENASSHPELDYQRLKVSNHLSGLPSSQKRHQDNQIPQNKLLRMEDNISKEVLQEYLEKPNMNSTKIISSNFSKWSQFLHE